MHKYICLHTDTWCLLLLVSPHLCFVCFLCQSILEGLHDLRELDMYGNRLSAIALPPSPPPPQPQPQSPAPSNPSKVLLLAKLETLNLGYNDLSYLPEDLDQFKSIRTLNVTKNLLQNIPMRVCFMVKLKSIDTNHNPSLITPPIEICERGLSSMRRYYQDNGA